MGQARSTGRASKASKNSSGLQSELKESETFHAEGLALLVSPELLRLRDLGQIDLARMTKKRGEWIIEIAEVKSSAVGIEALERGQRKRLLGAGNFLSGIFGAPTKFLRLLS